jgi:hypothetical protein
MPLHPISIRAYSGKLNLCEYFGLRDRNDTFYNVVEMEELGVQRENWKNQIRITNQPF